MATITTTNDPNRDPNKPVALSTGNVAPQASQLAPSQQTAPAAASGQYSTLQRYLGANQNAGQRIASQIGGNLENEATSLAGTSGRELNEAAGANTAFGSNINQANQFTSQLSTPTTAPQSSVSGKAYDVNSYATNLSGQQAAKDIAANTEKLGQLRGLASNVGLGDTLQKNKETSDREAQEALSASVKEAQKNRERQQQVNTESGRGNLLSQLFANNNYRQGLNQLDQAFLQNDKSSTLNQISNNLKSQTGNIQNRSNTAAEAQKLIGDLVNQGTTASTGLQSRADQLNEQYNRALQDRVSQVNAAKQAQVANLQDQFNTLRDTNVTKQSFADMLQLGNVQSADQGRLANDYATRGTTDPSGVRLFNILKNSGGLKDFLDYNTLEQQAGGAQDVANTSDIANLQALAAIAGASPSITQASRFQGEQVGESSLDEALNQRAQDFINKDLAQRFNAESTAGEDIMSSGWLGTNKTGTANASAGATATLNDYLYGSGIAREVRSGSSPVSGILPSIGGVIGILPGSIIGDQLTSSDIDYSAFRSPDQLLNQSRGSEIDRVRNTTEQQAVWNVANQADQAIANSGYRNLLRILQG